MKLVKTVLLIIGLSLLNFSNAAYGQTVNTDEQLAVQFYQNKLPISQIKTMTNT